MTNTSVTLQETGIADAINDGGPYESARNKMLALDFATQLQEMKAIARPARLRPRQRSRHHPRRNPGHRLRLGQPAGLLCLGRGQGHLRRRRAEARAQPDGRPRADRRPQPAARRRPRLRRLRAEQPRRKDPPDPPGATPAASTSSSSDSRSASERRRRDAREARAHHGAARRGRRSRPRPIDRSPDRRVWRLRMPLFAAGVSGDRTGRATNRAMAFASPSGTSR